MEKKVSKTQYELLSFMANYTIVKWQTRDGMQYSKGRLQTMNALIARGYVIETKHGAEITDAGREYLRLHDFKL
jgi:hypothetical protein